MASTEDSNPLTTTANEESLILEALQKRNLTTDDLADLQRIADGDPEALDEEYGFNNDELLRLGIGYGVPGPLSDERVRREAAEILSEMEVS